MKRELPDVSMGVLRIILGLSEEQEGEPYKVKHGLYRVKLDARRRRAHVVGAGAREQSHPKEARHVDKPTDDTPPTASSFAHGFDSRSSLATT
jgi:hypothetical protein